MKLLLLGSGGREHALAAKLRRDAPHASLFAAPGNPGIGELARTVPLPAEGLEALADFADSEEVDLTVVGPEAPLAAGIADLFHSRGLPLFGPSGAAARLEASKAFAKRLMRENGVPTAAFELFSDPDRARAYVEARDPPIVVKASGLAGGKGAVVCQSREAAKVAVRQMMVEARFGEAGKEVVIEECLVGEELSVFFFTDGETAAPLLPSRDYKRIGEGDRGPNTGGMGAYAPAGPSEAGGREAARGTLVEEVRRTIAQPVLAALAERGTPYRGFLYVGLMLTDDGPQVIEFNCRLGDPEAQVVLPLTRSSLVEPMLEVGRGGRLGDWRPEAEPGAAMIRVLASRGYPGSYEKGKEIHIPEHLREEEAIRLYHAGTAVRDGRLVTAGGRVLGATGLGQDLGEAAARSREAAEAIDFEGKQWRGDIGWHELGSRSGGSGEASPSPLASR
ncbi:MAG: phosphoribosylamine--glycine ligase [Gemmatimonadota bacterium]